MKALTKRQLYYVIAIFCLLIAIFVVVIGLIGNYVHLWVLIAVPFVLFSLFLANYTWLHYPKKKRTTPFESKDQGGETS